MEKYLLVVKKAMEQKKSEIEVKKMIVLNSEKEALEDISRSWGNKSYYKPGVLKDNANYIEQAEKELNTLYIELSEIEDIFRLLKDNAKKETHKKKVVKKGN